MTVSLIVAVSTNQVIGREGGLPWRLSADLRRFKRLTMGHHILMGRKTYESIGRLLPGRTSIVITRQADYDAGGALVAADLPSALQRAASDDQAFIIGGAQIYLQALPLVDRVYLTIVHAHIEGDREFPVLAPHEWRVVKETRHPADPQNEYDYSFCVLDRRSSTK